MKSKCQIFLRITLVNLLISGITFLVFLTNIAPREKVWDTGYFIIGSYGFATVKAFIHSIIERIVLLLILLIGFFVSDRYLSYGYLVGIALQVYRIYGVINPNVAHVDEWEWIYVIPTAILTIWILFIIQRHLNRKLKISAFVDELDRKIDEQKRKRMD